MVVIVDVVVEEEEEKILVLVEDVEKNSIKKTVGRVHKKMTDEGREIEKLGR